MAIGRVIDDTIFGLECLSIHLEAEFTYLVTLDGEEVIGVLINRERGSHGCEFIVNIDAERLIGYACKTAFAVRYLRDHRHVGSRIRVGEGIGIGIGIGVGVGVGAPRSVRC